MLHDSGYVEIFEVKRDETSSTRKKANLIPKAAQCFEERSVGVTRFYQAAQVSQQIDRVAEIWRDDSITARDVARIGSQYFLIRQVTHHTDEDGLLVTRLALEVTDGSVWEVTDG